ncbi:ParA family protein [Vibrio campbellii]|uniref:ParA family protein n=1 Tax=Vibrio campbellii TaxID=680 RepID=UPI001F0773A2|nr:ParA family protein [Vibrio campbellii]UMM04431.1 ParA family protein [Vibrio campbellii]
MLSFAKPRQTSIAYSKAKKIIVLNLKGGVGKSTFSASLASKLINNGHTVELVDFDKQQSTNRWAEGIDTLPNQSYNPSLRSLSNIAVTLKVSTSTDYVVIDSPANFSESDLVRYLRYVDYIVIPMQPSPIDLHASLPFINTLIEKHIFKSRQIKIGFVINRCVHQDERLDRVMRLLRFFRQFKTLGIMSESEVYQQPFMDKQLVDANDVDPKLWDNVIKWLD